MAREHSAVEEIGRRRTEAFDSEVTGGGELERQLRADQRAPVVPVVEERVDHRLAQATAFLTMAEQRLAEADARLRAADDVGKVHAERDLKAKLSGYSELLYAGRSDDAAEVMAQLLEDRRQAEQPIDLGALKDAVKRELRVDSALETFSRAYPEIIADVDLARIADRFLEDAKARGEPEALAFTEAGQRTRAYVKQLAAGLGMEEATSSTGRRRPIEDPDTPDARSSVIAEMAAQRLPGVVAALRDRSGVED